MTTVQLRLRRVSATIPSQPHTWALVVGGLLTAVAVAVAIIWLPVMAASLQGDQPHGFWYLSRVTAFVSFGLLTLSMAVGISITNRSARIWPGGPAAFDLHQTTSLLGLAFGAVHALVLLGDRYIGFDLFQVLVPLTTTYRPVAVALGQVGLLGFFVVTITFYLRGLLGKQTWRMIHQLSFGLWVLTLFHGITSGSDTGTLWATLLYWLSAGALALLTLHRVLTASALEELSVP